MLVVVVGVAVARNIIIITTSKSVRRRSTFRIDYFTAVLESRSSGRNPFETEFVWAAECAAARQNVPSRVRARCIICYRPVSSAASHRNVDANRREQVYRLCR